MLNCAHSCAHNPASAGLKCVFRATVIAAVVCIFASCVWLVAAHAQTEKAPPQQLETEYAKPIKARLNPTGRTITMSVPLLDAGRALGEVAVRIDPDDAVSVSSAQLRQRLSGPIDVSALARVLGDNPNGYLSLATVRKNGLDLQFDPGQLALVLKQGADMRKGGEISLARRDYNAKLANAAKPASVSGYVNVITSLDHTWAHGNADGQTGVHVDIQSALRLRGTVLENDVSFDGDVDTSQCPIEAHCVYAHKSGLKRRRTRIVHDLEDGKTRLQIGDVAHNGIAQQRTPDVLGASVEHSQRLRRGAVPAPSTNSALRIERVSDVEVIVNGVSMRRLRLGPGVYNLRDLPLASGANNVEIVVTDDTGAQHRQSFKTYIGHDLLRPGKSEWSVSGGVPSVFVDGGREYRFNETFATAYLRHGLHDSLTGEIHAQADDHVRMAGVGAITSGPWGTVKAEASASDSRLGPGYGLGLQWTLSGFRGTLFDNERGQEAIWVGAEYRSTDFRTPGDTLVAANGVIYPQYPYKLRLHAGYTRPIGNDMVATLSARYQFADPEQFVASPLVFRGDRFGIDLTVSRPLTQMLNAALTVGYGNEAQLRDLASSGRNDAEFRAMFRLYWRTGDSSHVTASYDSLNRYSQVSAWQSGGRGVGRWEANVDAHHTDYGDRSSATAGLTYQANRAELRASHSSSYLGLPWQGISAVPGAQRSRLSVGTAVAFADGIVAVGPPVRGDAFAIIYPHESLQGRDVSVGTAEELKATSGSLGPALVSNIPAYSNYSLPIDVTDLPIGYSLGSGVFGFWAPYKAGYALQVGSGHSVSVFGTLQTADGKPAGLLSGEALPVGRTEPRIEFFTNSVGRFGIEGLGPGRWEVRMSGTDGLLIYSLEIPDGTKGLFRAGVLKPLPKQGAQ